MNWEGFYGPGYAQLLQAARGGCTWDEAFRAARALHASNPEDERHWEFLAIGYLHLVDSGVPLPPEHATRLASLPPLFQRAPSTTNWRVMKASVEARLRGRFLGRSDLLAARVRPRADGYLPDGDEDDPSTQYHAYILLLLLRFGDASDAELREVLRRAIQWLATSARDHGDPSALGRGRFQLFGYAAMAAVAREATRWGLTVEAGWHEQVRARALDRRDGILAAGWSGPHRQLLLYGYNTRADYTRFAELWMANDPPARAQVSQIHSTQGWWYHSLGAGAGLVAMDGEPLVALLAARREAVASRRSALREVARSLRRPTCPPPRRLHSGAAVAGYRVELEPDRAALSVELVPGHGDREVRPAVVWVKQTARVTWDEAGAVDKEELAWRAPDLPPWSGWALRLVRRARVQLVCER